MAVKGRDQLIAARTLVLGCRWKCVVLYVWLQAALQRLVLHNN